MSHPTRWCVVYVALVAAACERSGQPPASSDGRQSASAQEGQPLPITMTSEQYERECKRQFGRLNPERMNVSAWEWMVRRGTNPYLARVELGLASHYGDSNPDFAFERFGMSRTVMPDGRIICIAGEHEDSYDPDFCIYNDVVVLRPAPGQPWITADSGSIEIYAYPEHSFPPTDFHSATLIGDRIFIIGRLGYAGTRHIGQTPAMTLDTRTYRVEPVQTTGRPPGWVYDHHASYEPATNSIVVRGGKVEAGEVDRETPNLSAYRLRLSDYTWELITEREKPRRFLIETTGNARADSSITADTFRPKDIPYEWLPPEEHGVWVYGLSVQGVRIRFEEFYSEIRTLVEGDLPPTVVDDILAGIAQNLEQDTGAHWTVREVEGWKD
jgi:hypothetical protein